MLAGVADLLEAFCLGWRTPSRFSRWVRPVIAFSGVRISWLMLARKALFARLAPSAVSLASASSGALLDQLFQMIAVAEQFLECPFPLRGVAYVALDQRPAIDLHCAERDFGCEDFVAIETAIGPLESAASPG